MLDVLLWRSPCPGSSSAGSLASGNKAASGKLFQVVTLHIGDDNAEKFGDTLLTDLATSFAGRHGKFAAGFFVVRYGGPMPRL